MENHEKGRELFFLAQAAREQDRHAEAEAYLREALLYAPGRESLRTNLCGALIDQGKHAEALQLCRDLVRDFPGSSVGWHRLSLCQFKLLQADDALLSVDRCLDLSPDNVDALAHRIVVLLSQGDTDLALQTGLHAVQLAPENASLRTGLGVIYTARRQFAQALESHRQALALAPANPDKQWNLALAQLMQGELSAAWRNMEGRWTGSAPVENHYTGVAPRWTGRTAPGGKKILVWAEQGLGDSMQFSRYIPLLLQEGADVIFQAPATLCAVMRGLPIPVNSVLSVIAEGTRLPPHDFNVPLMSLPACLDAASAGARVESIPAAVRVTLPAERLQLWHQRLGVRGGDHRPRVGLMWQGNLTNLRGVHRSMNVSELASVLALPFEFYCVSDALSDADATWLHQHAPSVQSFTGELRDFSDTAGLVAQLDLLISIDTSIAHLGPSLGVPTWVMLPWTADWRWGTDDAHTPWYPQSRLFRQQVLGQWQAPVKALHAALCERFHLQ